MHTKFLQFYDPIEKKKAITIKNMMTVLFNFDFTQKVPFLYFAVSSKGQRA